MKKLIIVILTSLTLFAFAERGVKDNGGLFSAQTIDAVNENINQVYNKYGKEILVESFAGIPDNEQASYQQNREAFFNDFLLRNAKKSEVNGVYLMLVKEQPPRHLRVQIGANKSTRSLFPFSYQEVIARDIVGQFKTRQYDNALRFSVSKIEATFNANKVFPQTKVLEQNENKPKYVYIFLLVAGIIIALYIAFKHKKDFFPDYYTSTPPPLPTKSNYVSLPPLADTCTAPLPETRGGVLHSPAQRVYSAPLPPQPTYSGPSVGSTVVGSALGMAAGVVAGNYIYDHITHSHPRSSSRRDDDRQSMSTPSSSTFDDPPSRSYESSSSSSSSDWGSSSGGDCGSSSDSSSGGDA